MSTEKKTVAFLVATEGTEEIELTDPWAAVRNAGHEPVLVSTQEGTIQAFNHLDKAGTHPVDRTIDTVGVDDFDALVLPGGVANPDALRMNPQVVGFVRDFVESGKPVASICHAAWVLVEADVVRGRRIAAFPSVQTDIRNAGGEWVDERVVVDGNLISSRKPDDLPAFNGAVAEALAHGAAASPA